MKKRKLRPKLVTFARGAYKDTPRPALCVVVSEAHEVLGEGFHAVAAS